MSDLEDFVKCTKKKKTKDGMIEITCKFGLWSVSVYDEMNATVEALHYFRQYKSDGEYSSIIGGKNTSEVLTEALAT